jgi:dTDP-4-amino-4,6-dideoxy-D-galactose acyltransferase
MSGAGPCDYLDWDSTFFGMRIGRVTGSRLTTERLAGVLAWAEEHSVECLYLLADPDPSTTRLAEDGGFHLVDVRVTLGARPAASDLQPWRLAGVRASSPRDVPALRAIAGTSHGDSRFYQDPRVPRPLCDELFRTWIEKSCHDYAAAVLVAECEGRVAGYLTCQVEDRQGRFGLVAVADWARRGGLGTRLVQGGLRWFAEHGLEGVRVATQGRNLQAQRLFGRQGFLVEHVQLWYHRWFSRHPQRPRP